MLHYVLLIGGIIVAVAGIIGFLITFRRSRKFAVLAHGEVTDIHEDVDMTNDGKKVTNYVPIVKFTANDEEISDMLNLRSKRKKKFKVGNKIDIYYNANNPKSFIAAKTRNALLGPIVLMIIGIAGILVSFFK